MRLLLLRPRHHDMEWIAAAEWSRRQGWEVDEVPIDSVTRERVAGAAVLWCHAGSAVPGLHDSPGAVIAGAVQGGAHLVLSLLATPLAVRCGAPADTAPVIEGPQEWQHARDPRWPAALRDWPAYPHIRGFQGWGEHPLFRGLEGGTYTYMAIDGDVVSQAVYERPHWPGQGCVVAVDRSYVHLDAHVAVAWEYDLGGRITCLGSNLYFCAGAPTLHAQRDALLRNALIGHGTASNAHKRCGWPSAQRRHARVAPAPRPHAIAPLRDPLPLLTPVVTFDMPDEAPFTLGAERSLATGTVAAGVREVWVQSLCVLDRLTWSTQAGPLKAGHAAVSAVHAQRELVAPDGARWQEVVASHPTEAEWSCTARPVGHTPGQSLTASFRVPLRRQWPFASNALAPLRSEVRRVGAHAVVVVTGCDGTYTAAVYLDGVTTVDVQDDDTAPQVRVVVAPESSLRLVVRASDRGPLGLTLVTRDLSQLLQDHADRLTMSAATSTRLTSDDAALERGWEWARLRLQHFMAAAPGGGRGLLAGYAPSRPGWHASRPGYAWFFARDACWSIDALLAAGLFDDARDAIQLLARTADVTGKIIHELTTSGVAHYDAADSTPLFLRAVAAYAEWTGDAATVRHWWPAVHRAFAFVLECDRDGDGLPENTGVGHGWIEMGPLGGGAVTSYVAAIWIDALRRLGPLARALHDHALAQRVGAAWQSAERGVLALRLPSGRLALHRDEAGRLAPELTALAAVPIALGVAASSLDDHVLDELAAPRFTAPWGLRMLPTDDTRYDPKAYHAGTVWPLFSGWAALADCTVGRTDQALGRVRSLVKGAMTGGTGGFAEVLCGDTGAPVGVCSDQAWSAAMVIAPVVTGLAGVRPDAMHSRCRLTARLPGKLNTIRLEHLRVGATRLTVEWARSLGRITVAATHTHGPPIALSVASTPAERDDDPSARFTELAPGSSHIWRALGAGTD